MSQSRPGGERRKVGGAPTLRGASALAEADHCTLDIPKRSMVSRIMSITTIVPVRPIPALQRDN